MTTLTLNDQVTWSPDQLATEVEGEIVLLSIENGAYYGLDSIGSVIWRKLANPVSIERLCAALADEFKGDEALIQRDVMGLLEKMLDQGLIQHSA